VTIAFGNLE